MIRLAGADRITSAARRLLSFHEHLMDHLMNTVRSFLAPAVLALVCLLAPRPVAAEAEAPPCEETACGGSCSKRAASFADMKNQPPAPPLNAKTACVEVNLPSAADPCVFEAHPACDCAAETTPTGTNVVLQGLPEFALLGDAPDGQCTRAGFLPGSCLLRGKETRCDKSGDGADCKAACDLFRTRLNEEIARSSGVTVDGSRCAASTTCACVFNLEGECSFADEKVPCGTDPTAAYNAWLAKERAKPLEGYCNGGSCAAAPQGSGGSLGNTLIAGGLGAALFLARRRRRKARR